MSRSDGTSLAAAAAAAAATGVAVMTEQVKAQVKVVLVVVDVVVLIEPAAGVTVLAFDGAGWWSLMEAATKVSK